MTNEEAKKMLKAKLECLKNEMSGINHDCNMRLCDGCSLNYEQGNMGEQKEALQMGAKALELLDKLDRIITEQIDISNNQVECQTLRWVLDKISELPSVTPQQKIGQWIFHKPFEFGQANCNECIECSQCHTWLGHDCYAKTPYCPICGAKMEVEE